MTNLGRNPPEEEKNRVKINGFQVAHFLIGPLYLIGMWFGENQRANIIKTHV
jgi:hypothetical protein